MTNQVGPGRQAAGDPPPLAPLTPRTSGLAVASLVCALFFFVPLAPLVGLILGIIAIVKISGSKGAMKGFGLAAAGVAIGNFFSLVTAVFLLTPFSADADREARNAGTCRSNLKQIGLAIGMYESDYDEQMPPDIETLAVEGYLKIGADRGMVEENAPAGETVLTCPSRLDEQLMSGDLDGTSSYYYAQLKDPQHMERLRQTPIMWEKVKSHRKGVNALFADLSVRMEPLDVLRGRIEQNAGLYVKPPVLPEAEQK